jgi:hypothetical protein
LRRPDASIPYKKFTVATTGDELKVRTKKFALAVIQIAQLLPNNRLG